MDDVHQPTNDENVVPENSGATLGDVAALGDRIEADLDAVDIALERLEAHSYGRCAVCDTPIDEALLIANPVLVVCPAHVTLTQ